MSFGVGLPQPNGTLRLAIVLLLAALVVMPLTLPPNPDTAWVLYVARRLLAGDRMFSDIVEVNPPLYVWLCTGVVSIADVLHVRATALYSVLVCAGAAAPVAAAYRIAARQWGPLRAAGIGSAAAAILLGEPGFAFGQREHLAAIAILPWVVASATPGGGGIGCGLLAGLGFSVKPYFVLPWLAIEGVRIVAGRPVLRSGLFACVSVAVTYAAAVLLFQWDYVTNAVRLASFYAEFQSRPTSGLLLSSAMITTVSICVAAVVLWRFRFRDGPALVAVGASLGFLAAMLAQSKGFGYHVYPAAAFAWFALITAARPGPHAGVLVLLLAVAVAAVRVQSAREFMRTSADYAPTTAHLIADASGGGPVLMLTARDVFVTSLLHEGTQDSDSPYPFLWMLRLPHAESPGARPLREGPSNPLQRSMFEGIWRLVERRPPRLVLFDGMAPEPLDPAFSIRSYFEQDPRFNALFHRCAPGPRIGNFVSCVLPAVR